MGLIEKGKLNGKIDKANTKHIITISQKANFKSQLP